MSILNHGTWHCHLLQSHWSSQRWNNTASHLHGIPFSKPVFWLAYFAISVPQKSLLCRVQIVSSKPWGDLSIFCVMADQTSCAPSSSPEGSRDIFYNSAPASEGSPMYFPCFVPGLAKGHQHGKTQKGKLWLCFFLKLPDLKKWCLLLGFGDVAKFLQKTGKPKARKSGREIPDPQHLELEPEIE